MRLRVLLLPALILVGAAWFFVSPIVGFTKLASAVATRNVAALDQRIDFGRLGRSLAPQIVWAYLNKTGRANMLGRTAASIIAGSSASVADAVLGEILNPEVMLKLLDTGETGGSITLKGAVAALPRGQFGSFWQIAENAEYGIGNYYIMLPPGAAPAAQYRVHMQLLQWTWKLVGIDLPMNVRDQLADELIRRIGS